MRAPFVIRLIAIVVCLTAAKAHAVEGWPKESPGEERPEGMFKVATDVVTPHTKWAKPYALGPVKALFIIPRWSGREVVELAQRMDLQFEVAMVGTPEALSSAKDKDERLSYAAERPSQVLKRLYLLLNRNYDVIVVGNVVATTLPMEAWKRIRAKVEQGAGLVLVPAQADSLIVRKSVLSGAKPTELPDSLKVVVPYCELPAFGRTEKLQPPVVPPASLYQVGKGRVLLVHYDPGHGNGFITPPFSVTQRRQISTAYDYYQSLAVKLLLTAANRLPTGGIKSVTVTPLFVDRRSPNEGQVRVVVAGGPTTPEVTHTAGSTSGARPQAGVESLRRPTPGRDSSPSATTPPAPKARAGTIRLRLREVNDRNALQRTLPLGFPTIFPIAGDSLPSGRYFADASLLNSKGQVVDWASTSFEITDGQGFKDLRLTLPSIQPGEAIRGKLALKQPLQKGEELWLKVSDFYDRVTSIQRLQLANKTDVDFEVGSGSVLSLTAKVRAVLSRDGKLVDDHIVEIPVRLPSTGFGWDDFSFMVWAFEDSHLRDLAYQKLREAGMDRLMSGQIPHEEHIRQGEIIASQHNCRSFPYASWVGDVGGCDYAGVREQFTKLTRELARHSCDTFSLGDEDSLTYYGQEPGHQITWPVVRDSFREYLKKQYPSLDALNTEWNTQFKSWDEVQGISLEDARKSGQEARWADHRMHLESFFAEYFGAARDAVQKVNPSGRAGFEGAFQTDSFRGYDWWKLMSNLNLMGNYWFTPAEWEFVGSFKRPDTYWGFWNGSYVDVFNRWCQGWVAWRCLLHGMNSVWNWQPYFGTESACAFSVFFPDLRLNPAAAPFLDAVKEIKSGVGKLLLTSERVYPGVAIHYSQSSVHANTLDDAGFKPTGAGCPQQIHASWLSFAWSMKEAGLQPKFISDDQIMKGELNRYRVFIMPFSQAVSPEEAAVIRKFVENGGILVADVRPAVRDGHCKLLSKGSLDDLFGIERVGNAIPTGPSDAPVNLTLDKHSLSGVLPYAQIDPNVKITKGKAMDTVNGSPVFVVNAVGQGLAILLNMTSHYTPGSYGNMEIPPVRTNARGDIFLELALGLAHLADIEPEVSAKTGNHRLRGVDVVTYHDGDASYYAFTPDDYCDFAWVLTMPVKMELSCETIRPGYFYDVRSGKYLGEGSAFRGTLKRGSATIVARLPYRVQSVEVTAPDKVKRGQAAQLQLQVNADNAKSGRHLLRVEVEGPDGKPRTWYAGSIEAKSGTASFSLPTAFNDAAGRWTLYVRDVASGVRDNLTLTLE